MNKGISSRRNPGVALLAGSIILLLLVATACDLEVRRTTPAPGANGPEVPGVEGAQVPLIVMEGPAGSTLAFVPVMIDGQGPFRFALDTGASDSVIARALATDLGLPEVGEAQPGVGVGGVAEAIPVAVESWVIGEVDLGEGVLLAMELPEGGEVSLQGLLGSDVLSAFGRIVVDYDAEVLILSPVAE